MWLLLLLMLVLQRGTVPPPIPCVPITHVLLISLDGARPDALELVDTPNIDSLIERGAQASLAQTSWPPATVPTHASMLSGLDSSEHAVDWNNYSDDSFDGPTLLRSAHAAGYRVAMIVGKEKLQQFHQNPRIRFVFAQEGDRSVVDAAIVELEADTRILFIHFPNPDYFGHLEGWMSPTYLYELENTDAQIGRLLAWLENENVLATTLILLTADHGGYDQAHGQNIPEDMRIPWIIAGPGVCQGMRLDEPVHVADSTQTLLWALGLPQPHSEIAVARVEAFERGPNNPDGGCSADG